MDRDGTKFHAPPLPSAAHKLLLSGYCCVIYYIQVWEEDLKWAQQLVNEKHKLQQSPSATDNQPSSSEAEEMTGAEDSNKVKAR